MSKLTGFIVLALSIFAVSAFINHFSGNEILTMKSISGSCLLAGIFVMVADTKGSGSSRSYSSSDYDD